MKRALSLVLALLVFGAARIPAEHALFRARAAQQLSAGPVDVQFGEQIAQLGAMAMLSGMRSILGDLFFIQAHVAWERTDWARLLLLFRQATMLQPHAVLFWDLGAWHLAWNASTAALNDRAEPSAERRLEHAREYIELGRSFLARGIENNPREPKLYEAMARLYRDKLGDHLRASQFFEKASELPGAPAYSERFAAYELSYADGHEQDAYVRLRHLYDRGEQERLPTLMKRLKYLEEQLKIPTADRIPVEESRQAPH